MAGFLPSTLTVNILSLSVSPVKLIMLTTPGAGSEQYLAQRDICESTVYRSRINFLDRLSFPDTILTKYTPEAALRPWSEIPFQIVS